VDDPDFPEFLDKIVQVTGAKSVGYAEKRLCCGGLLQSINEEISLRLTGEKLINIKDADVNALVTMCPFCFVSYNRNQATAADLVGENFDIPVVHFTQLLGLALGIPADELELTESVSDPDVILAFLQ
ncbi:MAG: heterodisulfide reductase-related iron-sulfur binding cluster, partial [Nitrososphaeria archaeon]